MIEIDDLISFSNKWFYIALLSVIIFGIIGINIYNKIREFAYNERICIMYFAFLCLFYFVDLAIYIIAIRSCPHTFISYFVSIYIPLPAVFFIAITSFLGAINAIKTYKWKIQSVCAYLPYSYLLIGIKICFAFAYGSLCAVIWILVDFILTLCKMFTLSESFDLYYDKKYD